MAAHGAPPPEPPIFRSATVRTAGQILTGPSLFSVFFPAHNGFLTSWQDWDPVDLLGCIYRAPDVMPSTMDVRDSRSNRRRRSGSPVPLRRTHPALSRCGRGRG